FLRRGRVLCISFEDTALLASLPKLLRDIQWLQEPSAALKAGPSAGALSKLFDLFKRPLNEGKLILVGRGEVGKTSLVRRLVENQFNEGESKTQGIRITNWLLPCDDVTFRLNI